MTPEQVNKYLSEHGAECPFCGSKAIQAGDTESDGTNRLLQRVSCECERAWWEEYCLTGLHEDEEYNEYREARFKGTRDHSEGTA